MHLLIGINDVFCNTPDMLITGLHNSILIVSGNLYAYNTTLSSEMNTYCPTFTRLNTPGTHYYGVYQVNVLETGLYTFTSTSGTNLDTFGYLYTVPFYPTYPFTNLVTYDDNGAGNGQFSIRTVLQSNTTYALVVTTSTANELGQYSILIAGNTLANVVRKTSCATDLSKLNTKLQVYHIVAQSG